MAEKIQKAPVTYAPTIAVDKWREWEALGKPNTANGYQSFDANTCLHRLLFDPRMTKVWKKLRTGLKSQLLHKSDEERVLYALMSNVIEAAKRAGSDQQSLSSIKEKFETVERAAQELLSAMDCSKIYDTDHYEAVKEILDQATARVLAASSDHVFKTKVSSAKREYVDAIEQRPFQIPCSAAVKRFEIAQSAEAERETNPGIFERQVSRTAGSQSGKLRAFLRTMRDLWLPHFYELQPNRGVLAKLAGVALDREVTTDQVKSVFKKAGNRDRKARDKTQEK